MGQVAACLWELNSPSTRRVSTMKVEIATGCNPKIDPKIRISPWVVGGYW